MHKFIHGCIVYQDYQAFEEIGLDNQCHLNEYYIYLSMNNDSHAVQYS